MGKEKLADRRQFFKDTLFTVTKYAVELELLPKVEGEKEKKSLKKIVYLRPPGAVEESQFISLCTRCDECIKVCPYQCIRYADSDSGLGTPVIVAREAACRLCSDFPCIKACKDGALRPVDTIRGVKIGIAVIDKERCLDYAEENFSLCQQCYRQCPLRDEALYLNDDFRPVIKAERCVGCGICENICQTVNPPATIKITPAHTLIITK